MQAANDLISFLVQLGDNALVLGHRNSEWTGHGPILEQDIALSNIALDLVGQARNLFQYAAEIADDGSNEDSLAYLRDAHEFRNVLLVEQPNGHWGHTVTRQFFFSTYQYYLYQQLETCGDERLRAIAEKSLKEVAYHLRWSGEWMIRLGDGTEESHTKMQDALNRLWPFTGEMLQPAPYETSLHHLNISIDYQDLKNRFEAKTNDVLSEAGLTIPQNSFMHKGGKTGVHTEHLGYLLAEMQFLQRAYPGANW